VAELLPALAERRARRAFSPGPVLEHVQELLWRAVSVAPSHGNTQPVRILVPSGEKQRRALTEALSDGNRTWAGRAPLLCALGLLPGHERTVTDRDGSERELYALHAGIALGNLLAQATAMGLIAHPMAGFDEPSVRAVFHAPAELRVMVVIAVGFPGDPASLPADLQAREARPQQRMPLEQLVVRGRWAESHGERAGARREGG
jgi:nitroreductase